MATSKTYDSKYLWAQSHKDYINQAVKRSRAKKKDYYQQYAKIHYNKKSMISAIQDLKNLKGQNDLEIINKKKIIIRKLLRNKNKLESLQNGDSIEIPSYSNDLLELIN